jgi:hypothetical protein
MSSFPHAFRFAFVAVIIATVFPIARPPLQAQEAMSMSAMMQGPLGLSHARMGSGTTWLPDSTPMYAVHRMWGDWTLMLHGAAFAQYDHQGSDRGDDQVGVIDWEMAMAMRRIGTGQLHLHGMFSLEPLTIGAHGYPLLLQTGETYKGEPLHDRQHPHDLFMEVAAMFEQPVAGSLATSLYAAAVGEPALGPVAYMHRPSAQNDPFAPLSHHWQDATHITFGVFTGALYSRWWKLEGSVFNGREPDENRWNFDYAGRSLDSYAGRFTVNPTGRVSLSAWYGYLKSPEALEPDESVHRYGSSLVIVAPGMAGGSWATTFVWGANAHDGTSAHSLLAETNLELGPRNAVFARIETVRKTAAELVVPNADPDTEYPIAAAALGYVREIATLPGLTLGLGGRASVNVITRSLEPTYGTRHPAGIDVFLRLRPRLAPAEASHQH